MDQNNESSTKDNRPWEIGQTYLIRTVTMFVTGRLTYVGSQELLLEDPAWIADTGKFSDALKSGTLSEVEAAEGAVIVGRGSIVDAWVWKHALPRVTK